MEDTSLNTRHNRVVEMPASRAVLLLRKFDTMSGKEILEKILSEKNPRRLVEEIPPGDFFWLVKKIGVDECLPLLELATQDQWQYILDLEIWEGSEINTKEALLWLKRLFEADEQKTVQWLLGEGNSFAFLILLECFDVFIRDEEDKDFEIPDGFFTHDGVFYLRAFTAEFLPFLHKLTASIAAADFEAYQSLMVSLSGIITAELEESMYRMRSVRLAEYGFLPLEEAAHIFSPLSPEDLFSPGKDTEIVDLTPAEDTKDLVLFLPLYEGPQGTFLHEVLAGISEPLLLNRLRLEFAGLTNQLATVEGLARMELETLIRLTRKTAGYLNLALEEMTKKNREHAREILRDRALVSIFRVGFGYVNRLKKDAEIWHENSWYRRHGFNHDFWGDERGSLLAGLFLKKPQLYTGLKNGEFYRDFSSADDLAKARKTLSGLISLDRLMEILTSTYPLPERVTEREDLICSQLIFTLWGRYILGLDVGFVPLPPAEARRLFATLRKGEKRPPYRMETYKSVFLDTMCAHPDLKTVDLYASLAEILLQLWEEFKEEYKDVPLKHTDMRYSPFLLIE